MDDLRRYDTPGGDHFLDNCKYNLLCAKCGGGHIKWPLPLFRCKDLKATNAKYYSQTCLTCVNLQLEVHYKRKYYRILQTKCYRRYKIPDISRPPPTPDTPPPVWGNNLVWAEIRRYNFFADFKPIKSDCRSHELSVGEIRRSKHAILIELWMI